LAVIDWTGGGGCWADEVRRQYSAARVVVKEAHWLILGYGPSSSEFRRGLAATSKVVRGWQKSVTTSGCSPPGGGMHWAAGGRGHCALCRAAAIGRSLRACLMWSARVARTMGLALASHGQVSAKKVA
jgi:hypothetical protein